MSSAQFSSKTGEAVGVSAEITTQFMRRLLFTQRHRGAKAQTTIAPFQQIIFQLSQSALSGIVAAMNWIIAVAIILAAFALVYWLFITTEGLYLGRRTVVWLYDVTASRYEGIKEYTVEDEEILVVEPVLAHLQGDNPLIVDVATGTGRVPRFLLNDTRFDGRVIGVDASRGMLRRAQELLQSHNDRVLLVRGLAEALPLPTAICPVLTCLEALEFIADEDAALREMLRVLQPGGTLLITRRRDREARLFFGRYRTPHQFEAYLIRHGLEYPVTHPWQSNYDLVIANKPVATKK